MRSRVVVCVALLAFACTRSFTAPKPPAVKSVAVFPPINLTGDELQVSGGTMLEKYIFDIPPSTVGDVIAAESRGLLASRGLTVTSAQIVSSAVTEHPPRTATEAARVASSNGIDAPVLFFEIRRWEPDAPFQPRFIIVSVAATLIDPTDGRTLWNAELPSRPMKTPGVVNLGQASVIAAADAVEILLAGFGTSPTDHR